MQGDLAMSSTLARNVHNELMMVNLCVYHHLYIINVNFSSLCASDLACGRQLAIAYS